ncbi:fluoroacetyl-CoA thioesterase [Echria macrotheca]|uniref:Fluoroacetyl-CoA thioesterase n=1 Tax=Echria macrotheca TaxID=438768 RepID=A0AAJ0F4X0_9PEZI|nr:fluoroacetyl-CoA thioesterase [Echria macrotheca]
MSTISSPEIGTTATASLAVRPVDLADAISVDPEDEFPSVFATSRLVALMEVACARILRPHLSAGQLSVGIAIDASHTAPTPAGVTVTAEATYTGQEGKVYVFEVVATDAGGVVGKAVHRRAIVDAARLEATGKKRNGL